MPSDTPVLVLRDIRKAFDGTPVLNGVSLTVPEGRFVTLLGPSGCGKTTTLRIIAGLEKPDAGSVTLNGQDVTALPPEKRAVNTVFQNYALFPHMTVARNIGYGLRLRGAPRQEIKRRVAEMLALIRLEGYENRRPAQLSGGQRQRVAIARAAVLNPRMLLLDEPLGALDLKLRREMQLELKELQRSLGIAFFYITHDQEEALNMSDLICVMNGGVFEQIGTPEEIYERPRTRFVARFIGEGALFEGTLAGASEGIARVRLEDGVLVCRLAEGARIGERCAVAVHAERIRYADTPREGFELPAKVLSHRYAGSLLRTELRLRSGRTLTASNSDSLSQLPDVGKDVYLYWNEAGAALIPGAEENP